MTLPQSIETKPILARDGSPLLEMVKIPAGAFLYGSSDSDPMAFRDEKPQKRIDLADYWIARTPVTNRMWQKFLQESGYDNVDHDGDYLRHWRSGSPPADKLDHPVVNISYINAWAFCDFYGLTLPCEAQWEKAARGTDGRIWPWGNSEPTEDRCNFKGNVENTTPVGSYPRGASPFGVLDCAGNALEWCADKYSDSDSDELSCSCRGGLYLYNAQFVRCAFRFDRSPIYCYNFVGFRPAQAAP